MIDKFKPDIKLGKNFSCQQEQMCLLCFSSVKPIGFKSKYSVTSDAKFINKPLSHLFCERCGYIFVNIENRVNYKKFYEESYHFLMGSDEIEPVLDNYKYSKFLLDFCREYLESDSYKIETYLDIGAGKGNLVQTFFDYNPDLKISALEPSKAYAKLREKDFLNSAYNSFFASKDFSEKFDLISLIGVLEHVPSPKDFIDDIVKIMHKNTLLLIEVPNLENNKSDLLTIDHLSKFTPNSLLNLFDLCGLSVVKKRITKSVPMQYIVKLSRPSKNAEGNHELELYNLETKRALADSIYYLKEVFYKIKKLLSKHRFSAYGQGLVLEYILGSGLVDYDQIDCVIDDNSLYHNSSYNNKLPIVDFEYFNNHIRTRRIFLAMNDCYHQKVIQKLGNYEVLGAHYR